MPKEPKEPKPAKRTRRPYSRDGCQECKNRKLKCDETKPVCWHCQRLSRECVYKKNIRFSTSRYFTTETVVLKQTAASSESKHQYTGVMSFASYEPPTVTTPAQPTQLHTPSPTTSLSEDQTPPIPNESPLLTLADDEQIEQVVRSPASNSYGILTSSASPMLPALSNNLTLNDITYLTAALDQHDDPPASFSPFPHKPPGFDELIPFASPSPPPPPFRFPLTTSPSLYNLTAQQSRYLDIFYHRTSFHIMPFSMAKANPVRDSILAMVFDNPILFSAVMAASSRTAYRITSDINDDMASCQYLSQALNSLSLTLSTGLDFSSISFEAVLTTVLILCTDHTSSRNLGWRAHLRGAKDLLDRAIETRKSNPRSKNSRTMAFCKVWFAALEVIAAIASSRGGTISGGFANHEAFADIGLDELQNAGMIFPNGFNSFLGYSTSCLSIFSELARLLKISRSPQGLTHNETRDIEKLISDIHAAKQITFDEDGFTLKDTNVFDEATAFSIPANDVPSLPDAGWFCISHKTHCEAAMLAVYTSLLKLPDTSPMVFSSFSTLMALLSYIPYKDFRGTMIHWPLLAAGLHAPNPSYEKFVLDRLDLLFQNGVWSAEFSKKRVRERNKGVARHKKSNMEPFAGETEDDEEELDTVPF